MGLSLEVKMVEVLLPQTPLNITCSEETGGMSLSLSEDFCFKCFGKKWNKQISFALSRL